MPYLYYRAIDILLRFKNPLSYGPPQQEPEENGLTGSMVLYMLLRVNTMVSKYICASLASIPSVPRCGWKDALEKSGLTYIKAIVPERSGAKGATVKKTEKGSHAMSPTMELVHKRNEQFRSQGVETVSNISNYARKFIRLGPTQGVISFPGHSQVFKVLSHSRGEKPGEGLVLSPRYRPEMVDTVSA